MVRWFLVIALVASLGAGASALFRSFAPATPIRVAQVRKGTVLSTVFATGHVEARIRRTLRSQRMGRVAQVLVREWDEVDAGTPLLRLSNPTMESRKAGVQAEVGLLEGKLARGSAFRISTEAQIREADELRAFAERDLERQNQLFKAGHVNESAMDEQQTRVRTASERNQHLVKAYEQQVADMEARLAQLRAEMDQLAASEGEDTIVSPIPGVVLRLEVETGEGVSPGDELVKVGDVRELILECDVDEDDLRRVQDGQEVLVRLAGDGDTLIRGRVFEIAPDATLSTKSFRVRAQFDQARFTADPAGKHGLRGRTVLPGDVEARSGMSAEVEIVTHRTDDALVIPTSALTERGAAFVVRDGRVHERAIGVGARGIELCEVTSGLTTGEVVATSPVSALADGKRVSIPGSGGETK